MCTLEKRGKIFILVITSAGDHRLNPTLIDEIRSALRQIRADTTISSGAALITTAEGKFFSNGYDLAWAGSSQSRAQIMDSKLRSLVADLISLPMPTIAAVTGHASAAGCILALSHDYVLMRKDRGFLYVSEVDIGLIIQAWFVAVLKSKIGRPMVMRDVALRADKVTATVAVEKGIIESAHDSAEETVKAAVKLAEDLTMRKWNGHVYAQNRIKGSFICNIFKLRITSALSVKGMCTLERRGKIFILTITGDGEHRLNPTLIHEIRSALRQIRADTTISSGSALITTAEGKFFSNGYDLAWAGSSQSRAQIMDSKLGSLVADLISLPMPTIAAVTGHASAAGCIIALSHDYVLMRKDRGFLYMSEVDIGLIIPAWFVAVLKSKIGRPMAMRDVVLKGDKVTAMAAVEKGIIDSAHDSAEETVMAAVKLGEELARRKWNGHVYAQIRMVILREVLDKIGAEKSRL